MNFAKWTGWSFSVVLACASAMTAAQSTPPGTMPARAAMPRRAPRAALPTAPAAVQMTLQDSEVIDRLHAANVIEVEAGKLAADRALSPEVKRYGDLSARDHARADQELEAFAKRYGIKLSNVDARKLETLRSLEGADFDRAFLTMMVRDHQNAIHMVKTAQGRAENSEVRTLLDRALPMLQQHEEHAQQLNSGHS
ncbi:MAG: DUF4142 domain-containing protein [Polyangiales bacterium]